MKILPVCPSAAVLLGLVLALPLPVARAQTAPTATLTPAPQRISDEAVQADHRSYEALQARIRALNDGGRPLRDYFLAKAQCWLDVSFHEYTRNDRSDFPQAAMTQAQQLVQGMEAGVAALPTETPLVNAAARLRPDLWQAASALRAGAGFACAQQKVACAEVELVHAGNEFNQQQWRHARPYVQIAEDLIGEARALVAACVAPVAAPQATPPVAPVAPVAVIAPQAPQAVPAPRAELQRGATVLFSFDRHDAAAMRPYSVVQLEALVQRLRDEKLTVDAVVLSGHADRLNGTGQDDYNQRLSAQRVATVKAELIRLGVAPAVIATVARGATDPVTACEARFTRPAELQECLLPNRRVEVSVSARRP